MSIPTKLIVKLLRMPPPPHLRARRLLSTLGSLACYSWPLCLWLKHSPGVVNHWDCPARTLVLGLDGPSQDHTLDEPFSGGVRSVLVWVFPQAPTCGRPLRGRLVCATSTATEASAQEWEKKSTWRRRVVSAALRRLSGSLPDTADLSDIRIRSRDIIMTITLHGRGIHDVLHDGACSRVLAMACAKRAGPQTCTAACT